MNGTLFKSCPDSPRLTVATSTSTSSTSAFSEDEMESTFKFPALFEELVDDPLLILSDDDRFFNINNCSNGNGSEEDIVPPPPPLPDALQQSLLLMQQQQQQQLYSLFTPNLIAQIHELAAELVMLSQTLLDPKDQQVRIAVDALCRLSPIVETKLKSTQLMLQDLKMRDCHITLGEGGVVMPDLYTSAYTTSTTTTTTTTARSSRRKAHTSNISSSGATFFNARNGGVGGSGRKPLPSKIPHQTVNVVIHNNTNMDIGDSLEIPLAHSPAASESASVTTISTNQSPVLLPHHQVPVCSSSPLLPPLPPSTAHNPPPSSSSATTLFIQGKLPPPPPSSQSPASPGSDSGESVSSAATRASNISSRTNRTTSASANKTTKSVVRQDNSSSTIGVLHHRAAQKARWMHKSNMEEAWKFMSSMSFKKTSKKK